MNTRARVIAAGMLTVALVACSPANSGSGSLQSVGTPAPAAVPTTKPSPTSSSAPAVPVAAVTTLALTATPDAAGTTVLAVLSTSTGAAAGGTVTFSLDGTALGTGEVTVTAQFAAGTSALFSDAAGSATFSIAKAGSSVTASVNDGTVRYGDRASFDITVAAPAAPAGTDLTGHVTVLDGADVLIEGDTDAAGQASLSVLNRADPGTKTYTVTYSGGPAVDASTAQFPVQTTQTNVDIAIDWTNNLLPGADATVTVDIVGTPDSPTGVATISYDGTEIANGPVDANGKISGTAGAVTAGDHRIGVSYAGDVRFEPNTASATLTVKEPIANPNAAGAATVQSSNPCPAAASACVDLSNDQAWLQSGGRITDGPVPITSGMSGYRTPAGMFSVFWRDKDHRSSLFNDAPMPNSVFFNGGIAFHQGSLYDQSHGCIHLSRAASETFFNTLAVGDAVYVWGAAPY